MYIATFLKGLFFLIIGFVLTETVLRSVYESFGISYLGNVWINWFAVSYLLYFLYTIINCLFENKNIELFKDRKTSIVFWVLLLISVYVVFIPFIKGENPF